MSSNDLDKVKQDILSFVQEKHDKCSIVKSLDTFVTNELLKHLNYIDKKDRILFKKCLEDIEKIANPSKKINYIETSKVIKGDFIKFEDYDLEDLFKSNNFLNSHFENIESINDNTEFTEGFSDI